MPSVILFILSGLLVCSAAPKTTIISNEIPKVDFENGEVSASFGGYQASAGLGGSLAGGPSGGLHAEASIPGGTGASAGLGGSVGTGGSANAGASVGGQSSASSGTSVGNRVYVPQKPRQRPPDYYDNIFNIPISVLQAVNQLLGGSPPKNNVGVNVQSRTASSSSASSSAASGSGTAAHAGTSVHAGTSAHAGTVNPVGGFFDQIFNIPISALRSVNQFLNAKNQQTG